MLLFRVRAFFPSSSAGRSDRSTYLRKNKHVNTTDTHLHHLTLLHTVLQSQPSSDTIHDQTVHEHNQSLKQGTSNPALESKSSRGFLFSQVINSIISDRGVTSSGQNSHISAMIPSCPQINSFKEQQHTGALMVITALNALVFYWSVKVWPTGAGAGNRAFTGREGGDERGAGGANLLASASVGGHSTPCGIPGHMSHKTTCFPVEGRREGGGREGGGDREREGEGEVSVSIGHPPSAVDSAKRFNRLLNEASEKTAP